MRLWNLETGQQAIALRAGHLVKSVNFSPNGHLLAAADMDRTVTVPGIGPVKYQVAFGGAYYAFVEAAPLGLGLEAGDAGRLIDYGRRIKAAVAAAEEIHHPFEPDLGFLYGVIFTGPPGFLMGGH